MIMRKLFISILILIMITHGLAQQLPAAYRAYKEKYPEGPPLSRQDSIFLMKIPEKIMPANLRSDPLPPVVDNSTLPYLRPVFYQEGPSCGQAAMVGYNFTYEMAYLRDQPAMFPQTQYPSHFTWNFQNGGNGWYGVSYFHSIEVLRTCGCMNSYDYGGYFDDGLRWINGYDLYYNGMFNRVKGVYSIKTGTEDGILALKHWLYDHMGEGDYGGVASFYANSPWNAVILAEGTPEAGKHVETGFYPYASHAMTIVGYNDSIRWDYNGDGQYTNNIDLNGDGILDPRDWEIGAFKFVNSYGADWFDQGYCYVTYKCLSETFDGGGAWNREVHILDADEDYQPLMTYKITLKHDNRQMVKILAGVSQDTADLAPARIMDFPILDFQGDGHYLQGHDTAEYLKSLEFGLDITPLLSNLEPGEPAKFFFIVDEKDLYGDGEGQITSFSLMDYTDNALEIISTETPKLLENDSRTLVSLIHVPDFDKVGITTDSLPPFTENLPYSLQLEADGGSAPYSWETLCNYRLEQSAEDLLPGDETQVLFTSAADTLMPVALGFSFPFFGEDYDTVFMHINGHLQLGNEQLSWPYLEEPDLMFRSYRLIAPVEYEPLTIVISDGDGGWVDLTDSCATFRWQLSLGSLPGNSEANFAVRLWPDGNMDFIYGPSTLQGVPWVSGISAGNNKDFVMSPASGAAKIPSGIKTSFKYSAMPQELELSSSGLLGGIPSNGSHIYDLSFRVTDDHGLSSCKTLQFTSGPYLFFTVNAGGDDRVDFGDTVVLDLEIRNGGSETLTGAELNLATADPYVEITDASCSPGTLLPGQVVTIPGAFACVASVNVPDQRDLVLSADLTSLENSWDKFLQMKAHAPVLQVKQYLVDNETGILFQGETAPFQITLQNRGSAVLDGVTALLVPLEEEVQVIGSPVQDFGSVGKSMSVIRTYSLHADESIPDGFIAHLLLSAGSGPGLQMEDTLVIRIGKTPVKVIDMDPGHHSGPGIYAMLDELNILASYEYNITMDINNYQSLFICLGYQNFNHVLTLWEGQKLADYLDAGGKIYMEGRKTWKDDPGTPVHPKFSVNTVPVTGVYDTINGTGGTFTQGLSLLNEASVPFSFYHFEPIAPAITILEDNDTHFPCAVANDDGTYKTIAALFEYGTMADQSPDAMQNLMIEYLEFFGIDVEPVGVEEQGSREAGRQGGLVVWPNPASGWLAVSGRRSPVAGQQSAFNLMILDLFGRTLIQFENFSSFPLRIDISSLNDGMYILRMTTADGPSGSAKFLKIEE
jgi:hypothetical protein